LLEEIGHGGMGVVYKARHVGLDRFVAIKMIRSGELADPIERGRFEAEARAVARLSHPNIVQIFEVGEFEGRAFLVLEYVRGESLADALRGPPFAPKPAATLIATLARAVEHAHEAGIVHRDLKPANILIQKSDAKTQESSLNTILTLATSELCPKITDFGLAKRLDSDGLTRTGDFLGTPSYASPEQAAGRTDVGVAVDVYSLGAILYHLITGRPPFVGDSPIETLDQVRFVEPVSPARLRPNLPRDLVTIVLTCLQKEPARRYRSAHDLADDLNRFLAGESIKARPTGSIERVAKWIRRRPGISSLLAFVILLTIAGLVSVTVLWRREAAARAAEQELREQGEAQKAELLIANARFAWLNDDLVQSRQSLSACPERFRNADWDYLDRACSALRVSIPSLSSTIMHLAFSPDGRKLISFAFNGDVAGWDTATGESLFVAKRGMPTNDQVYNIAFTPSGKLAAPTRVVNNEKGKLRHTAEMRLYDPSNGKVIGGWKRPEELFQFTVSPDGRLAAFMADQSNDLLLLDTETGIEQRRLAIPSTTQKAGIFSTDSKLISTRAVMTEVKVWDIETGAPQRAHKVADEFSLTTLMALGPNGRRYAGPIQHRDRPVELLVLDSGRELFRNRTPFAFVNGVDFSPDGRLVTTFGREQFGLTIWDADTGAERVILRGFRSAPRALTFSHDSRELAVAYQDGRIAIWTLNPTGAKPTK
jgi:WD40 repeat protein/tRNA A-37 threonylcarbamoyl transferase component Bud32